MYSCILWISFFFYSTNYNILFYILQHGLYHILFTLNFISYLMPYLNHPATTHSLYQVQQYLSSIIPFLINSSQDSANIMIRSHTYYSIFILFIDSCSLWISFFYFYLFFFYSTNHNIPFYISSHIFIISLSYLYHIFIISLSYPPLY